MRKTKEEAAQTRKRIIQTAATEFRKNGIDATGLAGLMSEAGLTQGGFYKHFESKDELVAEACLFSLKQSFDKMENKDFHKIVEQYLSEGHRDNLSESCAFSSLGGELSRRDDKVREIATEGLLKMVKIIAEQLQTLSPSKAKEKALVITSTMVGALMLSRVVTDEKLSRAILKSARASIV